MSLKWGIIGTGTIANQMGATLLSRDGIIYAITARNTAKLATFANTYHVEKQYANLADLLDDDAVDAVYVATPHNLHYEMIKQALLKGKHVLAEKAITVNGTQLNELRTLAKQNNLLLLEAMTVLHMPLIKKLKSLIDEGQLGQIKLINVTFGSHKPYDVNNRFFNPALAGGALLDIGGYALTGARYFMSESPTAVQTFVDFFETGVDEQSTTILQNTQGELATINLSMQAKQPKALTVLGTKGYFRIMEFPRAQEALWFQTATKTTNVIKVGATADALKYEIDDFEAALQQPNLATQYNLITDDFFKLFDVLRTKWGLKYSFE
ncbi:Gfo/Idh/MocA family protein [Periweissella beninensis]|uniref:Gfo/Idh/MocA family protein n=1 Tax=Periweissella beninensis TaxID=504936 RepID=UPI0021A4A074|nr:Gfo/Idh/MocA family oxidoreductase [Periweissella beninensis]MCT4395501.1 gfo/Idh/MocA family oxidoreductase [Periweissella beninensis]